jgi:hypothetical protein
VTFWDGTIELGTSGLSSGVALLATSVLTVGNHAITAEYNGTSPYISGTGTLSGGQTVQSTGFEVHLPIIFK